MSSAITFTIAEALQNSLFGRHGMGGGYAVFWGMGRPCWAWGKFEKCSHTRVEGGGDWCMQAMQPVWALLCFSQVALCLCWGVGLGNGAGQLLCSWRGVLVNTASYRHAPRRINNVPTVCLRCSSDCCVHALCPCVVCLPSLQAQPTALWALSHPSPLTFKLQALSPSGCKNSPNSAPFFFQASGFRETFSLWVPLCAPPTISTFSVTVDPSLLHPPWSVSPLNHISTLSTCFDVASYLSLVLEFVLSEFRSTSGVFRMIW